MFRKLFSSLTRNKSLLFLLLIVLIPILTLSYFLFYEDFHMRQNQETQKNLQMAEMLAQNTDDFLEHIQSGLESVGALEAVVKGDRKSIENVFSTLSMEEKDVSLYWITDSKGKLLAKYPNIDPQQNEIPDKSAEGKQFFEIPMKGLPYVSDRLTGEMTNQEIIIISVPYRNSHGEIAGVIGASIPLANLQQRMALKIGNSGYAILVSKSGNFLAHPKLQDIRQKVQKDDPIWRAIRAGGSGTLDVVAPYDGIRKFFSYTPMARADWVVIVVQPLTEFDAQVQQLFTRNAFIIFLVFLIVLLAARYLVLTRNREEEARAARSEKLAVVGELAAGMAHEIRNPLTAIKGFIQMIMLREDGTAPREYLETVMQEIYQIQGIVDETLILAKPAPAQIVSVQAEQIIRDVFTLMKPTAAMHNCEFSLTCPPDLPEIQAEPNRLKQAFVNLVKNSIESLPQHGGQVSIELANTGNNLSIVVKDTGCGMPKELIEKLGSPFLTTKGNGTGLGLTITFRIIQNHGGSIRVESSLGVGTNIFITLPLKTKPQNV